MATYLVIRKFCRSLDAGTSLEQLLGHEGSEKRSCPPVGETRGTERRAAIVSSIIGADVSIVLLAKNRSR